MSVGTERILFNMFYDMQSLGYEPYISKDIHAAVAASGKPLWIIPGEDIGDLRGAILCAPGVISTRETALTCAAIHGGGFFTREVVSYYLPEPVSASDCSCSGFLRKGNAGDVELVRTWIAEFFAEAMSTEISASSEPGAQTAGDYGQLKNTLYVWQDGSPSAMGMLFDGNNATARLNLIYTPKEQRRKGYAAATVRALSDIAFEKQKIPVLYTLAENAAANGLYKSVGFREAGRLTEVVFQ